MTRLACVFFLLAMIGAAPVMAQDVGLPVHGAPNWYEVVGDGQTSGTASPVWLAATRQVVGRLEVGSRFVAFGSDARVITLAYMGRLAYIPAGAAVEMYATPPKSTEFRLPGPTLTEQAEAAKKRQDEVRSGNIPLYPSFGQTPAAAPGGLVPGVAPVAVRAAGGREAL